jgi:NAD(P)-dependent dehydrogenase (short-subunit alcohol dehydrogenase family)
MSKPLALIVGVGDGLSASLARLFFEQGYRIALAARDIDKIENLATEAEATRLRCDASDPAEVARLFSQLDGPLRIAVYNPSARQRAPLVDLDAEAVRTAIHVTAYGAFLVGQQAARRMLEQNVENGARGTILFTGASAGMKGFPQSAPFATGKFAQRGLAQSMARELHPEGIYVV